MREGASHPEERADAAEQEYPATVTRDRDSAQAVCGEGSYFDLYQRYEVFWSTRAQSPETTV